MAHQLVLPRSLLYLSALLSMTKPIPSLAKVVSPFQTSTDKEKFYFRALQSREGVSPPNHNGQKASVPGAATWPFPTSKEFYPVPIRLKSHCVRRCHMTFTMSQL
ncbi:hypothetical protein C0J50_1189 [Silurus asotus]|uniref:Secreted protein n=1 Tax=Silurus asotus TaxID=30991 RepID=A0AAD5FD43_SILAS|nr:hypothetical protein C0J50_1189 [Silurus asotus]